MYTEDYIETLLENISYDANTIFSPCYPTSPKGITISDRECKLREEVSKAFTDVWTMCRVIVDILYQLTDPGRRSEPLTSGGKTEYTDAELVTAITAAEKQYRALLRDYWRRMKNIQEE